MVHGWGKERETSSGYGPNKGIHSYGAVGIKAIAVDDIVHALPERDQAAHAEQ